MATVCWWHEGSLGQALAGNGKPFFTNLSIGEHHDKRTTRQHIKIHPTVTASLFSNQDDNKPSPTRLARTKPSISFHFICTYLCYARKVGHNAITLGHHFILKGHQDNFTF
jgi:hypothetical protein